MPYSNGLASPRFAGPGDNGLVITNNEIVWIEVEFGCISRWLKRFLVNKTTLFLLIYLGNGNITKSSF